MCIYNPKVGLGVDWVAYYVKFHWSELLLLQRQRKFAIVFCRAHCLQIQMHAQIRIQRLQIHRYKKGRTRIHTLARKCKLFRIAWARIHPRFGPLTYSHTHIYHSPPYVHPHWLQQIYKYLQSDCKRTNSVLCAIATEVLAGETDNTIQLSGCATASERRPTTNDDEPLPTWDFLHPPWVAAAARTTWGSRQHEATTITRNSSTSRPYTEQNQ